MNDGGWNTERVKANVLIRIHCREQGIARKPKRISPVAGIAATVVLVVMLADIALGFTGQSFLAFFASIGGIGNDSRVETVENGFETVLSAEKDVALGEYYVDEREIGLSITIKGFEVPEGFNSVNFMDFKLEMAGDGEPSVWELHYSEDGGEERFFPGGHYISNPSTGVNEYVPEGEGLSSGDFRLDTGAASLGGEAYNISIAAKFVDRFPVGSKAKISVGGLRFGYLSENSEKFVTVNGSWSVEFDIEDKYPEAEMLSYDQDIPEEDGIRIVSASAFPTVFRIIAWVDFAKSGLANPDNARRAEADGASLDKLNLIEISLCAIGGDGKRYANMSSGYVADDPEGVTETERRCWFEIDSPYFDAPEELTLEFAGLDGKTVRAFLLLKK